MKIIVKAKPGARENRVEKVTQPDLGFDVRKKSLDIYRVTVKEMPHNGRANEAIVHMLAEYFDIPTSAVRLVSGGRAKQKLFEIS